jgi:Cys-tRNA(Pro)/Cys-tRNA(Cys) deacylase
MAVALFGGVIIGLAGSCSWNSGLVCDSLSQALHGRAMFGNLLALAGALAIAGYLMLGRRLRAKTSLIAYIFVVYATAAACLLLFMLAAGETPFGYRPGTYLWILLLALLPQLIGHSTYNWALAHVPAALVAIASLGEPIGSAVLAFFILHEAPPPATLIGGALILLGIYLSTRKTCGTEESMKLPSHLFLDERAIPYEARTFPPETEKGAANVARVLGFAERQAVKTLIFQADTGERVLVMLGGDQNAVSGNLKKAIGSRNIQMAAPEAVKETTGHVIGSIPPFCWQPDGFRSFLEASLLSEPILGVGAGEWGNEIMITPEDLVRASKAIVVNLTEKERPISAG